MTTDLWLYVCRRATYYVIYLHTPHALSASKWCAQPCPDPSRLRVPHTCTRAPHLRLQWLRAPAAELSVRAIIALLHALWYLIYSSANGAGRMHGAVPPGAGMPCHCRQRRALQKTPDDAGVVIIKIRIGISAGGCAAPQKSMNLRPRGIVSYIAHRIS